MTIVGKRNSVLCGNVVPAQTIFRDNGIYTIVTETQDFFENVWNGGLYAGKFDITFSGRPDEVIAHAEYLSINGRGVTVFRGEIDDPILINNTKPIGYIEGSGWHMVI